MSVEIDIRAKDEASDVFDDILQAVNELGDGMDELVGVAKGTGDSLGDVGGAAGGMKGKMGGLSTSVAQTTGSFLKNQLALKAMEMGLAAAKKAIMGVMNALGDSVGAAVSLEKISQQIANVSDGAYADMKTARQAVMDFSEGSTFGLEEVSASFYDLAALGSYTAGEMEDVISAASNLAVASGSELQPTVTLLAATLNAFGADASDAARYMVIMTNAANASALEVSDMGQALSTVGSLASSMGVNIEDLSAALAIMSNKGISADVASTSLRNALTRLGAPSGEAATQLRRMGVEIYDQQGNMLNLDTIMQSLSDSMGTMTMEQKNMAMEALFGKQSISAMSAILGEYDSVTGNTANTISALSADFDKTIDVTAQLGAMQDTTAAKMAGLSSTIDVLGASFGNAIVDSDGLGTAMDVLGGFLSDPAIGEALAMIGDALGEVIGVLATALGPVLDAIIPVITILAKAFSDILPVLTPLIDMLGGMLADAITMVTPFLEKLMPVIKVLAEVIIAAIMPALEALWPAFEALIPILDALIPIIEIIAKIIKALTPVITLLAKILGVGLTLAIKGVGIVLQALEPILDVIFTIIEACAPIVEMLAAAFDILTPVLNLLLVPLKIMWDIFVGIFNLIGGLITTAIDALVGALDPPQPCLYEALQNVNSELESMDDNMARVSRSGAMKLTSSIDTVSGGATGMAGGGIGEGGLAGMGNTSNSVSVVIEGDVKDEETVDRIVDAIRVDGIFM